MAPADTLNIEVVCSPAPGVVDLRALCLPAGSTLSDAIAASGLVEQHGLSGAALRLGIWGKVKDATTPLRERDRVEIYRELRVDPKEARRQRYQRHRERLAERSGKR